MVFSSARLLERVFPVFRLHGSMTVLGCLLLCGVAKGQGVESRPVAKLITATPAASRPRRVTTATSEPVIPSPESSLSLKDASSIERKAFEQTNAERERNGLPNLAWDPDLCRMARTNSENMARLGYFSHETPQGERLRDRARAVGITRYTVIGENIAYNFGYDDPGAFAVERWMLSSGHRANILNAEFKAMAVGSFMAADGSVFLTQTFITR
jgi:uncharacterized protein YkwD